MGLQVKHLDNRGIADPSRLTFLGLRGRMEAGWSRMNDLIVIQASQVREKNNALVWQGKLIRVTIQGLCAYVLEHVDNARNRGAVIGYDHRYNSKRWALLTALAFLDKGVKTYLYRDLVHTPMQVDAVWAFREGCLTGSRVPFGVKKLDAACGIMITGPCVELCIHMILMESPSQPQS